MVKASKTDMPSESVPSRYAETIPPLYTSYDPSFTLQSILEMQNTLGKLTQAVTTLTEESKKNGETLSVISHKVYGAQTGFWVAGVILGALGSAAVYILCEIWKTISPLVQLKPHP